jgi:ribosomal protein S18 acetylase RimI-like enzyme
VIDCRHLTAADIDLGMRLKDQAGWNQTASDWRRFLAMEPEGCFVAEWNGTPAGTTVVCLFDSVAWMAMVLVDAALRGRGIGKALLQRALTLADERGVSSVRLDATALGQPRYESLGFMPQCALDRYAGRLPSGRGARATDIRRARSEDYPQMVDLDRLATGCPRNRFLVRLFQEQPEQTFVLERENRILGFSTVRAGSAAWQLGPCIAEPAGADVLRHACAQLRGQPVLLDVPVENRPAVEVARAAGLQPQRRFVRMCRGTAVIEDLQRLWTSSGPELG